MNERPVVTVAEGQLRGTVVHNADGGSYFAFKGVPFAAAPTGELRFKDPRPPVAWTGIRDASEHAGDVCAQIDLLDNSSVPTGSEDCLYLNVYTTSISEVRPVMVFIHGGAFVWGTGNSGVYRPDYLVRKDIVLVAINYRVGVLGFLNLDHEVAAGNQGLKDQVAALRWVKENIASFGGDPNNLTIFGESAGGASVHYLTLSPLAKGLFHKAIAQSGSVSNPWASIRNAHEHAYSLASLLGKQSSNPLEVFEFLREVPVKELIAAQAKIRTPEEILCIKFPFGPTVDTKSAQPFFPRPVHEMVAEGVGVPLMVGYNSHEALVFIKDTSDETLGLYDKLLEKNIQLNVPLKDEGKLSEVAGKFRKLYFGDKPITKELAGSLVDFMTDLIFANGVHEIVENQRSKNTPTYFYRFSYVGEEPTYTTTFSENVHTKGTSHADDLSYLFYLPQLKMVRTEPPAHGSTDRLVMERFIRMWTDFARTGNPTPCVDDLITTTWEPVSKLALNYLEIADDLRPGVNLDGEKRTALNRIYALTR